MKKSEELESRREEVVSQLVKLANKDAASVRDLAVVYVDAQIESYREIEQRDERIRFLEGELSAIKDNSSCEHPYALVHRGVCIRCAKRLFHG